MDELIGELIHGWVVDRYLGGWTGGWMGEWMDTSKNE